MALDNRQGKLRGFSAPLDPSGRASLYGPTPWRFKGRSLTVVASCDPDAIAALTPAPLEPIPDAPVRHTDDLIGLMAWSEQSEHASRWFDAPGSRTSMLLDLLNRR